LFHDEAELGWLRFRLFDTKAMFMLAVAVVVFMDDTL
jgi:hypothetical protein